MKATIMKVYQISFFYGGIVGLLLSSTANSFELAASLYTNTEYSNNASRTSTATDDDITQNLGLNVSLKEKRKRFNADANFNLEEEHYYNNTFSSQTSLTTGFGIFNFDIIENFLNWRTSFTRTEVLKSLTVSDTPDNREQRNIFRTGPSITYRVSRESTLNASTNYTLVENSGEEAADTKRLNSKLSYNYALNNSTSLSLSSQYDELLDGDGGEEFKKTNFNLGIHRVLPQGELDFNYGHSHTRSDDSDSVNGNFFDLSLSRKKLLWHDFVLQYQQDISDTSIGFESDEQNSEMPSESGISSEGVVTGLDVITRKRLNLAVNRVLGVYQYSVAGLWEYEVYKTLNNDKKSRGVSLNLSQNISQYLSVGADYTFLLNDFIGQPLIGKDKISTYRLNSQHILSENLNLSAHLQYAVRSNSQNQAREYEELAIGLGLTWNIY